MKLTESRYLEKTELDSVTIVGMGPTACLVGPQLMRGLIPMDERNPVWAINFAAKAYAHTHAWNTHDLTKLAEKEPHEFAKFYAEHDRPLVTLMPVPDVPAQIYDLKTVAEFWQDQYFFAAPSYMIAYAAMCMASRPGGAVGGVIRTYGLDFDYPKRTDYEAGRACTEYWLGRVRTLGIRYEIPGESSLMDRAWEADGGRMRGYGAPFYGFFDYQPQMIPGPDGRFTLEHDPLGNQDQHLRPDRSGDQPGRQPVLVREAGNPVPGAEDKLAAHVPPEHGAERPECGPPADAARTA